MTSQAYGQSSSSAREFLFCDRIEERAERGLVLGKHSKELDTVAELRIASDYRGRDDECSAGFEFEIDACAHWKWVHALDVAAAETQVGGGAMQRRCAAFGVDFDGYTHFESRVIPSF